LKVEVFKIQNFNKARFQVYTAVKIQIEFLWTMTSWHVVVGPRCLHLQCAKMKTARSSKKLVSYHKTTRRYNSKS